MKINAQTWLRMQPWMQAMPGWLRFNKKKGAFYGSLVFLVLGGALAMEGLDRAAVIEPVVPVKRSKEPPKKTKKDRAAVTTPQASLLSGSQKLQQAAASVVKTLASHEGDDPQGGPGEGDSPVTALLEEALSLQSQDEIETQASAMPPKPYQDPNSEPNETSARETGLHSLVFAKDMDMRDALYLLAERYHQNIVPTPEVQGTLAFKKLYDVTFEEAMKAILGTQFMYQQEGNLFVVYPLETYQALQRDQGRRQYAIIPLYYLTGAEASKFVTSILSEDGKVEVTEAGEVGLPEDSDDGLSSESGGASLTAMHDTLMIYDYPEHIACAKEILAQLDVRPQQVLVEATILSATLTDGMELGLDWRNLNSDVVDSLDDLTSGSSSYIGSSGTAAAIGDSLSGGLTWGFTLDDVSAFIQAIEEVTDVTFLANPKILAVNKQLGQVYIGKKVAYQSQTTQTESSTTESVEFLDTGTKLSFRPYICQDGFVRMDIHPKDSSATLRSSDSTTLPDETSAELITNIVVKDGQTIVIGGLFRDSLSTTRTQVPLLGDLPLIGALFRGQAHEVQREEVIVLLTPHIIDPDCDRQVGGQAAQDVESKMRGARERLSQGMTSRRVRDHYDQAVQHYVDGDFDAALDELAVVRELCPTHLEAVRLVQRIHRELDVKALALY